MRKLARIFECSKLGKSTKLESFSSRETEDIVCQQFWMLFWSTDWSYLLRNKSSYEF